MIIYDIEDRGYEVRGIEDFSFGPGNAVTVSSEGKVVACYSFDCLCNDSEEIREVLVHHMHVDESFRRRRISTAVLEQIKEVYPNVEIPFLITPVPFEPAVRILRATIPDTESQCKNADFGLKWYLSE